MDLAQSTHNNSSFACMTSNSLQPNASTQERPEAAAAAQSVHSVLASIPVVEWFVRSPPPDDAPVTPRSRRRNLIN